MSSMKQKEYIQRKKYIKLSKQQQDILNQTFTMHEVSEAFKTQKLKKSPGSDGIPAEYYKKF